MKTNRTIAFIFGVMLISFLVCGCKFDWNIFKSDSKLAKAEYLSDEEATLRYPYQQLSDKEKAVYKALYDGIASMQENITLPYEIDGTTYEKIFNLIFRQEPQFFYLDENYVISDKMTSAKVIYKFDNNTIADMKRQIDSATSQVIEDASKQDGDYAKIIYIHDYIVENCKYSDSTGLYSNSVYGCFVEKYAQCEGYSKAFVYIARQLGINTMTVVGVTNDGINHEWNIASVNGNYYNLDLTWDDPVIEDDFSTSKIWHLYFNLSDTDISKTHTAKDNYYTLPECTKNDENYFYKNGLVASSADNAKEMIKSLLINAVNNGESYIDLRLSDIDSYNTVVNDLFTNGGIFEILSYVNDNAQTEINTNVYTENTNSEMCYITIGIEY